MMTQIKMANSMLLWLDDMRDPFDGDWVLTYAPYYSGKEDLIVWVKNYDDFVTWIDENGLPDAIAFDHDLGEDVAIEKVKSGMSKRQARIQKRETKSGYDCAKWLVEYCMDRNIIVPNWTIQSANPTGAENINRLLSNYVKHFSR